MQNFSITIFISATFFTLGGIWQVHAQNENKKESWEGYWGARTNECWNNKDNIPPIGFFHSRVENWEAMCSVQNISKASNSSEFDILHLQCMSKNNEKYSQDMRLKLTSDDRLKLVWPGGVGFTLQRCESKK